MGPSHAAHVATPRTLEAHFAMLRKPGSGLTRRMAAKVHHEPFALRAHRAETAKGPVWLVSGRSDRMCLFAGKPLASSCAPGSFALHHGITLGIVENPTDAAKRVFVLYGVVPDGLHSVRIRIGDRPAREIPVRHGAFSVRARELVVKL